MYRHNCPLARLLMFLSFSCCHLVGQSADTSDVRRYSEEGKTALASGQYLEAEHAYEKLQALLPGIAEVHAQLGLIYFEERKFDEAVAALRKALELKPGLPRADALFALSLSELGHYEEALPKLQKAFLETTDPSVKRMCGLQLDLAYSGLQRDREAVELAANLGELYPNDPEVLYRTGKVYGNQALLHMRRLGQIAPGSVWRHLAEAETYQLQGAYDVAISEYRQVLSVDSRRQGIHYRLGRSLIALSRKTNAPSNEKEALREFEEELQLDPTNASAAYEIAEIHRNAGELELAQKFFEGALKYYPDFEEAHIGLAAVLTSLHDSKSAVPHLQKAISLNAENEVSWYRLSQAYGLLGNSTEQKKAFTEFQRLKIQKSNEQEAAKETLSPDEVTKQQLDSLIAK